MEHKKGVAEAQYIRERGEKGKKVKSETDRGKRLQGVRLYKARYKGVFLSTMGSHW